MPSSVIIVRGDAARLPLRDASVDLIVTSPPYWSLRSYTDGGDEYAGQIGAEATPGEYVAALLACTREWARVLKPAGSIWVNLGDKYNAYNGGRGNGTIQKNTGRQNLPAGHGLDVKAMKPKTLMGLPWRYALGCVDQLGLILRAEVIWSKANGMPESVTDRVRRSHEQWFHLVKQPRYYSAVDEIREPVGDYRGKTWSERKALPNANPGGHAFGLSAGKASGATVFAANPLGKLPGSVWQIPTQPLVIPPHVAHARCCDGAPREGCKDGLAHHAAFPTELPRRIIAGWSPPGICTVCGQGRRPVAATQAGTGRNTAEVYRLAGEARAALGGYAREYLLRRPTSLAYVCACPTPDAPTRPAVVLDPFGGTGTTALVASVLGRTGISVDGSHDYGRIAQWRTTDPQQLAKARGDRTPTKRAGARRPETDATLF